MTGWLWLIHVAFVVEIVGGLITWLDRKFGPFEPLDGDLD